MSCSRNLFRCGMAAAAFALSATAASGDRWDDALARARELCAKMTLEEKAGELMVYDYHEFGSDRWGAYTNLVDRNEICSCMGISRTNFPTHLIHF